MNIRPISNFLSFLYFHSLYCSFPATDRNVTLLLTIMGGDTVTPTEVALVKSSDSQSINGTLEKLADGKFLVTVNSVPAGEFVVRVMGERSSSRSSNGRFQRQSITQQRTSSLVITVRSGFLTRVNKCTFTTLKLLTACIFPYSYYSFSIHLGSDR